MAVYRRLVSQADSEDAQILGMDSSKRLIVNDTGYWQLLFGPDSLLTNNHLGIKIAVEFDTNDLESVRFLAYLYDPQTGAIGRSGTVTFNVYIVGQPSWTETLVATFAGAEQFNSYFLADILASSLSPANLDGDTTLMIEAVITRNSDTYRDRVYLNHLGVYDSIIRLRNKVNYLDIVKLDE